MSSEFNGGVVPITEAQGGASPLDQIDGRGMN
jgi:hypothetical protein